MAPGTVADNASPWRDLRNLTPAQDSARYTTALRARTAPDVALPRLALWNYDPCDAHITLTDSCMRCGASFRRHQRTGLMWLYLALKGLLGDPTGTGKTLIILGLIAALREAGELGHEPGRSRAVVVAGAAAQWHRQCQRLIPSGLLSVSMAGDSLERRAEKYASPWDVLFLSPEMLRMRQIRGKSGIRRAGDLELIQQFSPGLIVYDDVDAMRHADNKTAYAVSQLCAHAHRAIGVHATPLQKRLMELHSFLAPVGGAQVFGPPAVFRHQYVKEQVTYQEQRDRWGHVAANRRVIKEVGVKNGPSLKRSLAPLVLRRTMEQIDDLEMPELVVNTVWLDLSPDQKSRYDEIKRGVLRKIREEGETVTHAQAMAIFMHGWQVCSGLATLDGPSGSHTSSVKLDWAIDKLDGDMSADKAVCFVNFVPNVEELSRRLSAASIGHVIQWGRESSAKARAERLERWRHDPACRVLIGTTSIERSLDLQAARHLIAVDTVLNPARMTQIAGRVKRAGSPHSTVYLHQLLARGTQEDAYPRLLAAEQAVADYVWSESAGLFNTLTPLQLLRLVSGDPELRRAAAVAGTQS